MANEPTPQGAARHATTEAPLERRAPILLGTFGTETDRQALVKRPDGTVLTLSVGDQLDGAPVTAIADLYLALGPGADDKLWIPGEGGPAARSPLSSAPPAGASGLFPGR